MAKRSWVREAFSKNKGALHREIGVKEGKKIGKGRLRAAAKKGGRLGKRARLAATASKFKHY